MADVTSCKNSLQVFRICFLACQYLFDGCQNAASFAKTAMVKPGFVMFTAVAVHC